MYQIIIVIHVLLGLGIIGLIMIQQGKGADAGASFGTGSAASVFGAQGAGSFLSRTTATLAALFFLTSLGLAVLNGRQGAAYDLMSSEAAKQSETKDAIGIPQADINKTVEKMLTAPQETPPVPETSVEQKVIGEKLSNPEVIENATEGNAEVKSLPENAAPISQQVLTAPETPKEEFKPVEEPKVEEVKQAPVLKKAISEKPVVKPKKENVKVEKKKPVAKKKESDKK